MPRALLGDVGTKIMETWSCPRGAHSLVNKADRLSRGQSSGHVLRESCPEEMESELSFEEGMGVHRGRSKRRQGQMQRSGDGRYYTNNTNSKTRLTMAKRMGTRPCAKSHSSPHFTERKLRLSEIQVLKAESARTQD